MKAPYSSVQELTIGEASIDAGREKITKDFHVILSDEVSYNEKLFRPFRGSHFTIFLTTGGECVVQSNLIKYPLGKHSLFIVAPGVVHQFLTKNEDCIGIVLQFTKDFLTEAELHKKHIEALAYFSLQNNPHIQLLPEEAGMLENILLFLRQKDIASEKHPFRNEVIHHAFSLFLFEMASFFIKYQEDTPVKITRREEVIMNFVKLLTRQFKVERSVQYYADHLFVTPKHLSKTVKEITGKTAGEFIDEMVITEAKVLLDDAAMSVGNVADELHFSDQFFFSKFFKNHTGVNPSEYRSSM